MTTTTTPDARTRLARISSVVDEQALLAAMQEALPGVPEADLLFASLSDEAAADLVARFDRPGTYVKRYEQREAAELRVLLPSGDMLTIRAEAEGVNWPGCGTMSADDAVAFAGAVALAASIAADLAARNAR